MVSIRPMNDDDLPFAMSLKAQAGWNQVEADWQRLLALQPDGAFVAEFEGVPVGTVMTVRFGPIAWVAMMLVAAELRRQGIGRRLMRTALDFLDAQGPESVRLDATHLGRPLYESLGFNFDATILRYAGEPNLPSGSGPPDESQSPPDLDELAPLDQWATGTDRRRLLQRLLHENDRAFDAQRSPNALEGYAASRPGSSAAHIGPCIAAPHAGPPLLARALQRFQGQAVFVDVPAENAPARHVVESAGLTVARELARMTRGRPVHERRDAIWAGFGPELG